MRDFFQEREREWCARDETWCGVGGCGAMRDFVIIDEIFNF